MTQSFRTFLILLPLPLIALWVYFTGMNYTEEPLLLQSQGKQATLPLPEIDGYTKPEKTQLFLKDNLYEHVNGHAEFFISNGFESLNVAEYSEKTGKGEIVAEIFDMNNSLNAKSTILAEKGNAQFIEGIGEIAYGSQGFFLIQSGKYYIKLALFNIKEEKSLESAKVFSETFKSETVVKTKTFLPELNKVPNSAGFVKEDYMGLPFMKNIETALYQVGENKVEAFYTSDASAELVQFFTDEGAEIITGNLGKLTTYMINDNYEGTINVLSDGKQAIGIKGSLERPFLDTFFLKAEEIFMHE
ncbi:MAG: hypothetical protein HQK84_10080 [Nitrospinae bacterium]|nr:hypothetical protein [Nitrospinota bacterium]